ncbi:hypothetical protein [uncultured Mediterranean phage]|nr:hypothetical protein [uncultured Mediterranean phage]
MPKTKHHKKKYPNSEWVRRRNIRKSQARLALGQSLLEKKVDMEVSKENTTRTPLVSQEKKQKGLFHAIKNVFVGRGKNTKSAV